MLQKLLCSMLVIASLSACAHYDVRLQTAQDILDNYRHAQSRIEQGQLP